MNKLKKIVSLLAFAQSVLYVGITHAQTNLSVISGSIENTLDAKMMHLYNVVDGVRTEVSSSHLGKDGAFAFALNKPEEGLYYISVFASPTLGRNYTRVYLKPSQKLEIKILGSGEKAEIVKGDPENILLNKWDSLSFEVYKKGAKFMGDTSTYLSYFPALEQLLPKVEPFRKKILTPNRKFNIFLSKLMDADIQYSALGLLNTPRRVHPDRNNLPNYYKIFKPGMYCDAFIAQDGDGAKLLNAYVTYIAMDLDSSSRSLLYKSNNGYKYICNDTLKGIYTMSTLFRYRSYESLESGVADAKQYFLTPNLKDLYFNALKAVSTFKAGTPGYNFNYPDTAGKKYSLLKELSGKVVYVDLWATWCGPCKAEIPHLQKLEEEFKDENVAFVSISIDELKDKEKWKKFVFDNKLGGLQLYAGGWGSDVTTFYGVHAIPRFMIFDTKGNIVSTDAPRPSNPEVKDLLIKTLKKG